MPRFGAGAVNLAKVTRDYMARRRLECGGADMGGAHALNPKGPGNTFTLTQLFAHRQWFRVIPRPCEAEWALGFDRPGRHAQPFERLRYQMSLTVRQLGEIGLFG